MSVHHDAVCEKRTVTAIRRFVSRRLSFEISNFKFEIAFAFAARLPFTFQYPVCYNYPRISAEHHPAGIAAVPPESGAHGGGYDGYTIAAVVI
jgi:hypothetical protein